MSSSSRKLLIPNPSLSNIEDLVLSQDITSGDDLYVESNVNADVSQIVVVEGYDNEKSELAIISSLTNTNQITATANLKFSHYVGCPLFLIEFNQIEISKAPVGSGWSVLDTIDIQPDKYETIFIDHGGLNTDSYRFRFYNSASGNYSEYSATVTGGGYSKNQVGYWVEVIQKRLKDKNEKIMTIDEIIDGLNEAKGIIADYRNDWWFWKKRDNGTITTVAGTKKYNLDDIEENIDYIKRISYYDNTINPDEKYSLNFKSELVFDGLTVDQNPTPDDSLSMYTLYEPDNQSTSGYIVVYPTPKTTGGGSFYVNYYKEEDDYTSMSDVIEIPRPEILIDIPLSTGFRLKGNTEMASYHEKKFHGPSKQARDRQQLTGIALLENAQKGKLSDQKPRSLKKYIGRNGLDRMYTNKGLDRDTIAEDYFDYPVK